MVKNWPTIWLFVLFKMEISVNKNWKKNPDGSGLALRVVLDWLRSLRFYSVQISSWKINKDSFWFSLSNQINSGLLTANPNIVEQNAWFVPINVSLVSCKKFTTYIENIFRQGRLKPMNNIKNKPESSRSCRASFKNLGQKFGT